MLNTDVGMGQQVDLVIGGFEKLVGHAAGHW
jgi:hypothetical protein